MSYQVDYYTTEYNVMYDFADSDLTNYTDEEWQNTLAARRSTVLVFQNSSLRDISRGATAPAYNSIR